MKATELQIGDYVNYRGQIIKVTSLYDKGGSNEVGWSDKESVWVNADNVEPIPLTPEVLEKNGFETDDGTHFSIQEQSNTLELLLNEMPFGRYDFHIVRTERTTNKCNQRCYIDRYFASIDYVHQLQHALRLCGIEKEIEYLLD